MRIVKSAFAVSGILALLATTALGPRYALRQKYTSIYRSIPICTIQPYSQSTHLPPPIIHRHKKPTWQPLNKNYEIEIYEDCCFGRILPLQTEKII